MFWRKNKGNTLEEQGKLWEHIKSLEAKVIKLEAELEKQDQSTKILRTWVNRKLKIDPIMETEDPIIQEEDKKVNDGFDFIRNTI